MIYSSENGARQIYDLGNGNLYKFRPHMGVFESDIHALLKSTTRIPVPTIYNEWVTSEGITDSGDPVRVHHMVMEKIEGEPLVHVWEHLSSESKARLALQLGDYLDELHNITRRSICSFDGGPLCDSYGLIFEEGYEAEGPISDSHTLWLAMTSNLQRDPSRTMHQALAELRSIMPACLPAVLTHTDLHQGNILVRDGNISAIIDWEGAGFYPRWPAAKRFMDILLALRTQSSGMVEWAMKQMRR
ncbi:kinase-like protein [Choiromyces venosus 120613-1]|uniref:Kinase-like protein n=1 Tax=Choiromyces venosus 120613-1 TaxID=1336337 RepID=A0A3N4JHP0_9PEZI|nr:kinase-like protein [Choiromyces venosus 120613-1]